ncbi:hypothetical protein MEA186_36024 [Mesorhizobium amorphae CCNWGS0123]|uniref:Uncharacterized protein n=1 Tax=Mesorhizobium amorphae CCNWGS0123 TaxID=1082933 RepID=G6YME7_9HYPH|nr:hypothetical protein MEA186_36024 [Mesorhizobium amorphae CCNWGS0123]
MSGVMGCLARPRFTANEFSGAEVFQVAVIISDTFPRILTPEDLVSESSWLWTISIWSGYP